MKNCMLIQTDSALLISVLNPILNLKHNPRLNMWLFTIFF